MLGGIMGGPMYMMDGRHSTMDDLKGLFESRQINDVYADAHYDSVSEVGTSMNRY